MKDVEKATDKIQSIISGTMAFFTLSGYNIPMTLDFASRCVEKETSFKLRHEDGTYIGVDEALGYFLEQYKRLMLSVAEDAMVEASKPKEKKDDLEELLSKIGRNGSGGGLIN